MVKLTKAQTEMLETCVSHRVAWATSVDSPNHVLLREWQEKGWAEETEAPASILVAYVITAAGIAALLTALSNRGEHHD